MQSAPTLPDRLMGRLLFVDVQNTVDHTRENAQTAETAFGFSLMFSGVRCILQYAILPFVLPVIGIATDAAIPLLMVINILAMISVVFSLRRFWRVGYKYRWQYLIVAVVALLLLTAFLLMDLHALQQ